MSAGDWLADAEREIKALKAERDMERGFKERYHEQWMLYADTVRRVEALADEWEADQGIFSPDSRYTRDVLLRELRSALAD